MAGTTGGRRRPTARPAQEGGPATPGLKGKNFVREEEEQLCYSVLHVSQDRIVGNQQKGGVFWSRISQHYDEHRPAGFRPSRSLESKWGLIKHDVSRFVGIYAQVLKLNKSGSSLADTLNRANELYKVKHAKGCDFTFHHCWVILKDHPKWAEGWTQVKPPTGKRKAANSDLQSNCVGLEGGNVLAGAASMEDQGNFNVRPGGTKAAKEDQR
jgi:hypothetical protein